jgi:hypothetical protein
MDWWNDIDKLAGVVQAARGFAAVGAVIVATAGVLAFRGATRLEQLRGAKAAEEAAVLRTELATAKAAATTAEAAAASVGAEIKTDRERLRMQMAPRTLSHEQLAEIAATLRAVRPVIVNFTAVQDDEAGPLGDLISNALTQAGWTLNVAKVGMMLPARYGILIDWTEEGAPAGLALKDALAKAGLAVTRVGFLSPGRMTPAPLSLLVGTKPTPQLP